MDTLILDPHQSQRLVAERHARGLDPTIIESDVLPLRFRLVTGAPRPTIEVVTGDSDRSWTI